MMVLVSSSLVVVLSLMMMLSAEQLQQQWLQPPLAQWYERFVELLTTLMLPMLLVNVEYCRINVVEYWIYP